MVGRSNLVRGSQAAAAFGFGKKKPVEKPQPKKTSKKCGGCRD